MKRFSVGPMTNSRYALNYHKFNRISNYRGGVRL